MWLIASVVGAVIGLSRASWNEVCRRKAEKIRPGKARAFHRDAIMLSSWTDWHLYLDLLQHMALIDKINIEKTDSGMIYTLAT